ncbi:MAG: PhoH family protein [Eisenbergiella sp.]
MSGGIIEDRMEFPAEHLRNVYGQFDEHIKKLERSLNVTLLPETARPHRRSGEQRDAPGCREQLLSCPAEAMKLRSRINYAIASAMDSRENALVELDGDCICHTVAGRPVKPKTLGQKQYVDAIRDHMIVFGVGPAGTGKTYLAMAMAITAFRNDEVSRIILTRPAIEAGEKLGFLPGDLQSKVDPYLRPLYDALYRHGGRQPEEYGKD